MGGPRGGAYTWLDAHRGSEKHLREISVPGVDTKFAERHRATLAALLGVPSTATGFLTGLGLRTKPQLVRLRVSPGLGLPTPLSEPAVRAEDLAALQIAPAAVLVCENEITFLSVQVPKDGAVIWGEGFEVDRVGRLPWLRCRRRLLGRPRHARLRHPGPPPRLAAPHPLGAHGPRDPSRPPRPLGHGSDTTRATLTRLPPDEHALYIDLVGDHLGDRVRLEQERINGAWAEQRLLDSSGLFEDVF